MASLSPYSFHNTDRIGSDSTDQTQNNISNKSRNNLIFKNVDPEDVDEPKDFFCK